MIDFIQESILSPIDAMENEQRKARYVEDYGLPVGLK